MKSRVKNASFTTKFAARPDYYHQNPGYAEAAALILLGFVFIATLVFGQAVIPNQLIVVAEVSDASR